MRRIRAKNQFQFSYVAMLVLLLSTSLYGKANSTAPLPTVVSKVGIQYRHFADPSRKNWEGTALRPVETVIWYPANNNVTEDPVIIGEATKPLFLAGQAAENAELANTAKRFPLVLVSHGTGGAALQMMWLGQYLAAHGFIVAALNHHGNTGAEDKPAAQGFMLWWERSKDLKFVLDELLRDKQLGTRIDQNRIGAAGFSLGGATVISLAGGVFDIQQFENFCQSPERDATCEPQPEFPDARKIFDKIRNTDTIVIESLKHANDSFQDNRIKAVFAIAPALGSGFTTTSLTSIKVPISVVIGNGDRTTPLKTNAQRFTSALKNANLTVLPGNVGHYTFLSECGATGKMFVPVCKDGEGVDRAAQHDIVNKMALAFFKKGLRLK